VLICEEVAVLPADRNLHNHKVVAKRDPVGLVQSPRPPKSVSVLRATRPDRHQFG
jgi:hypothetical protein